MSVVFRFGALTFPCAPEEFTVSDGSELLTYRPTDLGEVVLPRGRRAQRISWSSWLPGRDYADEADGPFFSGPWQDPATVMTSLRALMEDGENGVRRLTIGAPSDPSGIYLSRDMFLTALTERPGGRDFYYSVEFVESRSFSFDATQSGQSRARRSLSGYAARGGDTLFVAAARVWGDTSRWRDLRDANPALALLSPESPLPAGTTLIVPGG